MSGEMDSGDNERRKQMSCGLYISCPHDIRKGIDTALSNGYHFIVTQVTHPGFAREFIKHSPPPNIGRTDRVLKCPEWNRLIVAEFTPTINVDSEIFYVQMHSKAKLNQELAFAIHLGIPAFLISLNKRYNSQLARIVYEKILTCYTFAVWVSVPMIHPSRFSQLCTADEKEDSWEWWNDFRTSCKYDKRLGVVLELPDVKHVPPTCELDRWLGEPVKAIVIPTTYFLVNTYGKPVLSKVHQEIIQKFIGLDVQYVIRSNDDGDISVFNRYLSFLGRKLCTSNPTDGFYKGMEDFLQNPLQPLSEHLDTNIYEVFEKDQIKYTTYQNAIQKALESLPQQIEEPVLFVVGPGRGPLIQAALNVSYILHRKIKLYAVEKNPFAINTLIDRVENEWDNQVTLVNEDMRVYDPPQKADIIISELLGSFGDNELSPECLDGAQRFLKKTGLSIPASYTSYIAPIQSVKIYNEINSNRPVDKTVQTVYETPYVVHLVNYYQIDEPQPLFTFHHPNWNDFICNQRYKRLRFSCRQNCVLTGFAGFFDTVLFGDVVLSTNPKTHTPNMVSWFPIVFPLPEPVQLPGDSVIEVSFWREESNDKVWYEWCLESPVKGSIVNPTGRSYFIRKIC